MESAKKQNSLPDSIRIPINSIYLFNESVGLGGGVAGRGRGRRTESRRVDVPDLSEEGADMMQEGQMELVRMGLLDYGWALFGLWVGFIWISCCRNECAGEDLTLAAGGGGGGAGEAASGGAEGRKRT